MPLSPPKPVESEELLGTIFGLVDVGVSFNIEALPAVVGKISPLYLIFPLTFNLALGLIPIPILPEVEIVNALALHDEPLKYLKFN